MAKPTFKILSYIKSFSYAIDGLSYVIRNHASFTVQSIAALFAVSLGFIVKLERLEWVIILSVIFAVLVAELLNTSIETSLDYMAKEHHIDVKIGKDVAAGAVFLTSIGSVFIGLIIFLPYFL
ncbi:diacylglycerol kinase family protein [bacterium]|uniref:Diacylglycerol kinase n=2 Tax=Katanobacteria TaxID=422282 RepID=A0A2M7X3F5_UNCKA|nr:diacylglycerol kinase family protein [bacterium]PIP56946.1 MAG: diacylglycerol kinase [candidate division WWE3 bacterium CG22_combo_CG10-13_8_21_14_all_39_12]PJA40511.1 MAG: diacylglycerol kinase [candidate division WWE3 bacterium CG_4_9_14_3_um_filter_39_7]